MSNEPPGAAPSRATGYTLLPLVVLIWGANWPLMKIGLTYISPLWLAVGRLGLGAICLFALLALTGRLATPTRRDLAIVVSLAVFQAALFLPLANYGLRHVPAGRSAVLAYTTPLWVVPGAVLFLGERLTALKLGGLVSGILGVAVLFNPLALDWSNRDVVLGSGALMLAAMSWSVAMLHIRHHRWHLSALQLMPWQLTLACLLLVPPALAVDGLHGIEWNATSIGVLLYNGTFATAFCYWAATSISRALPAITSSLSFLAVPAAGIFSSQLVLGERPDFALIAGFALILAGVTLVSLSDWRDASLQKYESP
ncbi:MAG: DMT family transporter [Candidatus Binatia bacterium]